MPSPETHPQIPEAEIGVKEIEPRVRSIHNVSIDSLLGRDNPSVSGDEVSLYKINRENGEEYAVVFPPLTGLEVYKKLLEISVVEPGILDVSVDVNSINRSREGYLATGHQRGMGGVWGFVMESLPLQDKIFHEGREQRRMEDKQNIYESLALEKIKCLTDLSEVHPELSENIMRREESIISMIEGKSEAKVEELIKFFDLTAGNIAATRSKQESRKLSKQQMNRKYKGKNNSEVTEQQWTEFVIRAAKQKVLVDEENPDVEKRYDMHNFHNYSKNDAKLPTDIVVISKGKDVFTIPKVATMTTAEHMSNDEYRIVFRKKKARNPEEKYKFATFIKVNDLSEIEFVDNGPEKAEEDYEKAKNKVLPLTLVAPIVRFKQTTNGTRGFIFHETGSSLPKAVVEDIKTRVDESGKSIVEFDRKSISGVFGVDNLVAANFSEVKKAKLDDEDNWSEIWDQRRITMSQLNEEERKEGERDQFNGPVQAEVVAIQAFGKYQGLFEPLMDNVVARFEEPQLQETT